ncbi:methyltransferase family protein [Enterococcus rivorum]|uniref:Phospholipid methyltransferase n=1 Tax=Enterococcus rivorum TaxID=762845 RepID=A0A1E5KVK3_9ENTE|nr:isoprenylcysteine carboxylmethyltransferase family protein [Enterococcus rivorum]MBP2098291.1 protein-S-isoprenylcysteine O-methyltransferase Ste14 [Enterococcus rivorum]OEH81915.1 phospholipid methyltransferase [Enterococcus rivorum]
MNSFVLIIPLLIIRFIILGALNPTALKEVAYFAPLLEKERIAYYVYQLANALLIIFPFFLKTRFDSIIGILGGTIYLAGILLLLISTTNFAKSTKKELRTQGIYRFSRNPMYVGYFLFFLGCVLITKSVILFVSLISFQISSHWIILSEERWCQEKFGEKYLSYKGKVRRYF